MQVARAYLGGALERQPAAGRRSRPDATTSTRCLGVVGRLDRRRRPEPAGRRRTRRCSSTTRSTRRWQRRAVRARHLQRLPRQRPVVDERVDLPRRVRHRSALTPQERILEYMIWDLPVVRAAAAADDVHAADVRAAEPRLRTRRRRLRRRHPVRSVRPARRRAAAAACRGQCGAPPPAGSCTPETCAVAEHRLRRGERRLRQPPRLRRVRPALDAAAAAACPASAARPTRASAARPRPARSQNIACGPAGDGCGGLLDCGSCPRSSVCGGGGVSGPVRPARQLRPGVVRRSAPRSADRRETAAEGVIDCGRRAPSARADSGASAGAGRRRSDHLHVHVTVMPQVHVIAP